MCDVNGWSFVKNSHKYFDDAALCLRAIILQAVAPHHSTTAEAAEVGGLHSSTSQLNLSRFSH